MAKRITIGLSLSLTGEYAAMGRQAEAALRLLVADLNAAAGVRVGGEFREVALECIDDASDAQRCAEIYRALVAERRVDLLLGPYSSGLVRAAAPIAEEARMVLVNHGGAADDLYERGYGMIVGVLSPASAYLTGFVRLLATLKFWRKRLAIVAQSLPFASAVASGVERAATERAARRRGVRVRVKWNGEFDSVTTPPNLFPALARNRVNALVSAGSFAHDVAVIRAVTASELNIPVLACVAAGVERFGIELGEHAEGIVGPSQWEEGTQFKPEIGPDAPAFGRRMHAAGAACDYVAAQAFAAGLLAKAAVEAAGTLDQDRIRSAFSGLRTTTLYGDFAIDRATGRQTGHKMLLVQWHRASKVIIEPESQPDRRGLALMPGRRLIAAGLEMLRMTRGEQGDERDRD